MTDSRTPDDIPSARAATLARAKELKERSRALVARALELRMESDALHLQRRRVGDVNSSLIEELRTSVEEYAAALRILGETPEHMVIRVKEIAVDAGREVENRIPRRHFDHDGLREDIVRWATQAYFAS